MKKITLGLLLALMVTLAVSQAAYADVPGPRGSTDCIAFCIAGKVDHGTIYRGPAIGTVSVSDFARDHNPSDGTAIHECGLMKPDKTISDLNPPQP